MSRLFLSAVVAMSLCNASLCMADNDAVYKIDTSKECQTMDYFSASDAWSMLRLGLWPEEKQRQVADWLFSTENDADGQPKGIGLSLWRFNVGAGSVEQGDARQVIEHPREERTRQFLARYNQD